AVGANRTVWTVGYQDVIAIGHLFTTGKLYTDRVIALAGPQVNKPRLVRTCVGADLAQLTAGELAAGENRIISGSVFGGRTAADHDLYPGGFHPLVSLLADCRDRPLLLQLRAGAQRFSVMPV